MASFKLSLALLSLVACIKRFKIEHVAVEAWLLGMAFGMPMRMEVNIGRQNKKTAQANSTRLMQWAAFKSSDLLSTT